MKLLLSASIAMVSIAALNIASGGRGAPNGTEDIDPTLPPLDTEVWETATTAPGPPETTSEQVTELSVDTTGVTEPSSTEVSTFEAALLTAEDLGGDWETEGAEVLEFGPTAEPFTYCPNGDELMVPVAGTAIMFVAPSGEVNSLSDDEVSEAVLVFEAPEDAISWFDGVESCVGQAWEESSDPVEHVSLERSEAPELGDESRGFRTIYAHSEGLPVHDNTAVLVRLGEVLVVVDYSNHGLDEPVDQAFFDSLIETAVSRVEVVPEGGVDDGTDRVDPFHRPVSVIGDPLPELSAEIQFGGVDDPAIGLQVPVVSGVDYEGNEIAIDPASDGPTMVVLLAHWCPHCDAEIPVLDEWRDAGEIPDGLNIVGVSTGVSADAPNYPPDEWLQEMDWQWPVLADDRAPDADSPAPAMGAYGGTSYPTFVIVDADGRVRQRLTGAVPIDDLAPIVDDLMADLGG